VSTVGELPPVDTDPWSSRRSFVFDVALTGALLLGVLVMAANGAARIEVLLSLLQILPLVARRTHPATSFALVATAMAVQVPFVTHPVWGQVAMPVAVYSVTTYARRDRARAALLVALLGGLVGPVSWLRSYGGNSLGYIAMMFAVTELLVIAPWALGSLSRTRRAYVGQLIERGHRLAREAEQRAELAASDERARIAREMHDVIAHGLSMMIVQADGASYAVHQDPDSASKAMATVSATGRDALAEMRRMLGVLRAEDDMGTGTRPQPGLADLGYLLDQSRSAGLEVVDRVGRPLPAVPPGVGLTVYRIVQEGLTNVRKHAGPGACATVTVRAERGALVVEVADDGRGPATLDHADTGGHGLLGMRERVAVHGGTLHVGGRPGGGFVVRADVPTEERSGG
jgi:signal transduction histidine kinase